MAGTFQKGKIAYHFREILKEIGEDPNRAGLEETPERIEAMYKEVFSGINENAPKITLFDSLDQGQDLIVVKDINFSTFCEHHFLPFFGVVHFGYIPNKNKYAGISKIARVVDFFSKRPQVQERLTCQIADYLFEVLECQGLIVVIEAGHLCMTQRGVNKANSKTVTSAIRGRIDKQEFLELLKIRGQ